MDKTMTDFSRLENHAWYRADPDEWLRRIMAIHFDPEKGAPYWLGKAGALGFDPLDRIRKVEDLALFGPMDEKALRERPVHDFLPRSFLETGQRLIPVESSGTTGPPKTAPYSEADFFGAFIASFRPVAEPLGFPLGKAWLFIGPTGPHAIGRAARILPRFMESAEPFTVDFDPRWVRKLPEGSMARDRYMAHLIEQALAILLREPVKTVFATPPTLLALAERLNEKKRESILGIHFGGMEVTRETRLALREAFPRAAQLSGYGNSLFGVSLEMGGADDRDMDYFPVGPRHLIRILREEGSLDQTADPGETGRIVMSRLDESCFYPNLLERDHGTRIPASEAARGQGFFMDGVRNPHPPKKSGPVRTGFY